MRKSIVAVAGLLALVLAGFGTYRVFSRSGEPETPVVKRDALGKEGGGELGGDKTAVPVLKKHGALGKEGGGELGGEKITVPVLQKHGALGPVFED
jgi:hypothetical protein